MSENVADAVTPQIERFTRMRELAENYDRLAVHYAAEHARTGDAEMTLYEEQRIVTAREVAELFRAGADATEQLASLLADRERLTRENAELRQDRNDWREALGRVTKAAEQAGLEKHAAERRAEALATAIREYGQHKGDCHLSEHPDSPYCDRAECDCTCGLRALLTEQD